MLALARFLSIFCPTLFAGVTAQYSFILVDPTIAHAPNEKIMAKLWLQAYQLGPYWVPPLILPGTIANLYLAISSTQSSWQRYSYLFAACSIFSILMPITFFYMEPGINGACKWKVQLLLKEEGFMMPDTTIWKPSAHCHGGTQKSREWAEKTSIIELMLFWRKINNLRWILAALATIASAWATFSGMA
ncbi:hypothetical protein Slin15195_G028000 [Septoria linicola]|uniref:Uncharacterized protein n=1 Tax=Septoria linicola TaxID=215465 RepID=A0A9Q9ARJ5_9PEZI|nr:hypothetical protein Slin14017_G027050 [Septoria linicola]USW49481.1 hypothetical protein Slin15195_G028000 [Septoria linicola]